MASRFKGPLLAYRIADSRHTIFDGEGAALYGGRWNSPGRQVIYAASSYAGAMLEILAHAAIGRIPQAHAAIAIRIPKNVLVEIAAPADVPGWDAPDLLASHEYGDRWLSEKRSAVLFVPSVVAPVEHNVLINPDHPDFKKIRAGKPKSVVWDKRLFQVKRGKIR